MRTKRHLDRESRDTYHLIVRVFDSPPSVFINRHFIDLHVDVEILDANDNTPKFYDYSLQASIMENTDIGTLVTVLQASDIDLGRSGLFEYGSALASPFFVDPVTGNVLVTSSSLDRERQSLCTVPVFVRDKGEPSLTTFANLTIRILDIDDHEPKFLNKEELSREIKVAEDAIVGTVILKLEIEDLDDGSNAKALFWIKRNDK